MNPNPPVVPIQQQPALMQPQPARAASAPLPGTNNPIAAQPGPSTQLMGASSAPQSQPTIVAPVTQPASQPVQSAAMAQQPYYNTGMQQAQAQAQPFAAAQQQGVPQSMQPQPQPKQPQSFGFSRPQPTIKPIANAGITKSVGPQDYIVLFSRRYQKLLDDLTPHTTPRWAATIALLVLYLLRILIVQGWYVVTYALGIYLLNLFLAFLTPKFDPALEEALSEEEDAASSPSTLPTRADEEFKPFIRRLPEFKFWYWATRAITIAFLCTFVDAFDIPVFWPILLVYFFILFGITMKRQIKHMIKYKYVPFDLGKKRYTGRPVVGGAASFGKGK